MSFGSYTDAASKNKRMNKIIEDAYTYYTKLSFNEYKNYNSRNLRNLTDLLGIESIAIVEHFEHLRKEKITRTYRAKKYILRKEYKKALKVLRGVKSIRAYFLKGAGNFFLNKIRKSLVYFQRCTRLSDRNAREDSVQNLCKLFVSRILYMEQKNKKSVKVLDKINFKSIYWPDSLLDKAWNYHKLKNYNRVIGVQLSYKHPTLNTYYNHEAHAVVTLALIKLCRWYEAFDVLDELKKRVAQDSTIARSFIRTIENEKFRVSSTPPIFNRYLLGPMMRDNVALYEYLISNKIKNRNEGRKFQIFLKRLKHFLKKYIHEYLGEKTKLFTKNLDEVKRITERIEVEVLARYRKKLKEMESSDNDFRKKVAEKLDKRRPYQYYWEFKEGEFWSDEIGSYNYDMKSHCHIDEGVNI